MAISIEGTLKQGNINPRNTISMKGNNKDFERVFEYIDKDFEDNPNALFSATGIHNFLKKEGWSGNLIDDGNGTFSITEISKVFGAPKTLSVFK